MITPGPENRSPGAQSNIRAAQAPLVADGTLVVPVAGVYPLEHIHDAVQHLLRGGKILLKVA
jgi:NADPH:quinone reductase-like Zn-dependent oxidoreductase